MSTKIKKRVQIRAPYDRVVAKIGSFGSLAEWHPAFDECEVEGEGDGAVRTTRLAGGVIRDRLDEVAEDGCGYRYTQLEGPISFTKHHGYLWVTDEGEDGASVEWAAKLSGSDLPDAAVAAVLEGLFEIGLNAVQNELEQEPD